jgi:PIN domain nuclease of toxin-antitoxin system
VRLLLDTHLLVWWFIDWRIPRRATELIRDPFDRLLVSQSLCESMSLLTNVRTLAAYGPTVIVAG